MLELLVTLKHLMRDNGWVKFQQTPRVHRIMRPSITHSTHVTARARRVWFLLPCRLRCRPITITITITTTTTTNNDDDDNNDTLLVTDECTSASRAPVPPPRSILLLLLLAFEPYRCHQTLMVMID